MDRPGANLPPEIEKEAGRLISELQAAGWTVSDSLYDPKFFGNWYVDLDRASVSIRVLKDRSQYMIDGRRKEELEPAGLWRAFDNIEEFRQLVVKWAANPTPQRPR